MNLDQITERLRARFLGRTTDHEDGDDQYNRARLRAAGLQGARDSIVYKDGAVTGRRRGSFLEAMARPSILVSHASGWQKRGMLKMMRGQYLRSKTKRTLHRMRARGEEL